MTEFFYITANNSAKVVIQYEFAFTFQMSYISEHFSGTSSKSILKWNTAFVQKSEIK